MCPSRSARLAALSSIASLPALACRGLAMRGQRRREVRAQRVSVAQLRVCVGTQSQSLRRIDTPRPESQGWRGAGVDANVQDRDDVPAPIRRQPTTGGRPLWTPLRSSSAEAGRAGSGQRPGTPCARSMRKPSPATRNRHRGDLTAPFPGPHEGRHQLSPTVTTRDPSLAW
jgi:hypothetical protein